MVENHVVDVGQGQLVNISGFPSGLILVLDLGDRRIVAIDDRRELLHVHIEHLVQLLLLALSRLQGIPCVDGEGNFLLGVVDALQRSLCFPYQVRIVTALVFQQSCAQSSPEGFEIRQIGNGRIDLILAVALGDFLVDDRERIRIGLVVLTKLLVCLLVLGEDHRVLGELVVQTLGIVRNVLGPDRSIRCRDLGCLCCNLRDGLLIPKHLGEVHLALHQLRRDHHPAMFLLDVVVQVIQLRTRSRGIGQCREQTLLGLEAVALDIIGTDVEVAELLGDDLGKTCQRETCILPGDDIGIQLIQMQILLDCLHGSGVNGNDLVIRVLVIRCDCQIPECLQGTLLGFIRNRHSGLLDVAIVHQLQGFHLTGMGVQQRYNVSIQRFRIVLNGLYALGTGVGIFGRYRCHRFLFHLVDPFPFFLRQNHRTIILIGILSLGEDRLVGIQFPLGLLLQVLLQGCQHGGIGILAHNIFSFVISL